ncbi:unnamed protein product [Calypogeia fissa]
MFVGFDVIHPEISKSSGKKVPTLSTFSSILLPSVCSFVVIFSALNVSIGSEYVSREEVTNFLHFCLQIWTNGRDKSEGVGQSGQDFWRPVSLFLRTELSVDVLITALDPYFFNFFS